MSINRDFGYGLPSFNTSWISNADNGHGNALLLPAVGRSPALPTDRARAVAEPSSSSCFASPWRSPFSRCVSRAPGHPSSSGRGPDMPRRWCSHEYLDTLVDIARRVGRLRPCGDRAGRATVAVVSPLEHRVGVASARPGCLAQACRRRGRGLDGPGVFAPVLLAIALLIRLDSPGPVLFRQVRRGHRGRPFRMLKFRTMVADAEQRLGDLESCNESAGGVLFKLRHDPRVTRLGRFLRRSSLDELPQLINVLKGEMSLVGPRPLQLRDSDRLRAVDPQGYRRRLQVLPGLTGPWQVGGRSDLDYEQMVELDLDYVANHSLGRDLVIIGRTIPTVVFRRGAC